jgi:hypothetical protein
MKTEYTVRATLEDEGFRGSVDVIVIYHGSASYGDVIRSAVELLMEGEINVLDSKHVVKDADGYVQKYILYAGEDKLHLNYDQIEDCITEMKIVDKEVST